MAGVALALQKVSVHHLQLNGPGYQHNCAQAHQQ
jgi:hypothetical protein